MTDKQLRILKENYGLKDRVEFLEQYTQFLDGKIDENHDIIRVHSGLFKKLVDKLVGEIK